MLADDFSMLKHRRKRRVVRSTSSLDSKRKPMPRAGFEPASPLAAPPTVECRTLETIVRAWVSGAIKLLDHRGDGVFQYEYQQGGRCVAWSSTFRVPLSKSSGRSVIMCAEGGGVLLVAGSRSIHMNQLPVQRSKLCEC
jgi:hypothetical protein